MVQNASSNYVKGLLLKAGRLLFNLILSETCTISEKNREAIQRGLIGSVQASTNQNGIIIHQKLKHLVKMLIQP